MNRLLQFVPKAAKSTNDRALQSSPASCVGETANVLEVPQGNETKESFQGANVVPYIGFRFVLENKAAHNQIHF